MRDCVTLVHLSDLQYGKYHRFPGQAAGANPFDTLEARLLDDLRLLREEHQVEPDLLVLTGDLAEWGKKREFEQVQAFVTRLAGELNLPLSRVAVLPGNHDINRDACEAYFKECSAEDLDPVPPFAPKWKYYRSFFSSLYESVPGFGFTEERPYTLFEFPEIRTVIAGLNSTMPDSHRDEDHYGEVGEPQLRWFADSLQEYARMGWLRIAAVHHNVRRGDTRDDENLRDAGKLNAHLGGLVNLVLHGHTHHGKADVLRQNVPIYATGSAAVEASARPPEVPNQYQVLRICRDRVERFARAFIPDEARPHFALDPRASDKSDECPVKDEVRFDRVHGVFPDAKEPAPPPVEPSPMPFAQPMTTSRDDLLSRVERVAQLRHPGVIDIQQFRLPGELPYLRVNKRDGDFVTQFPVAVVDGVPSVEVVRAFASTVHARYRSSDFNVPSYIVYGSNDPVPDESRQEAKRVGAHLQSWIEYQGLLNLKPLVDAQTERLKLDVRYPPFLYVPQRYRTTVGLEETTGTDALDYVFDLMTVPESRFVVVLGEFGTGKSFLQRQLAIRLAEAGHPLPIFIEMRTLEKGRLLDELIAQHLVRNGFRNVNIEAFRYMLEQGRVALLFDGFDELVVRVTYERAAEHLQTLLQAAGGKAKVVVTSARSSSSPTSRCAPSWPSGWMALADGG